MSIRAALMAAALVAVVALTGCGDDAMTAGGGAGSRSGATSASTPPQTARADRWLLPDDALPAGWRRASGQQQLGVPALCGVTLEPPALADAATRRYAKAYEGPFVVQYSFVSADESATRRLMDRWAAVAAACTTSEADGVTLQATPLPDVTPVGEGFGAVHAAAPGGQQRDYVAFRDGVHVTVLVSVGLGPLARHDELAAFARAVAQR